MKSSILLAFVLTAPIAVAQTCFSGPPPGTLLGNTGDTVFPIQPIGFVFPFAGATYTDIHVSDHGLAFLSNAGVPTPPTTGSPLLYTPSTATLTAGSPMICALWSDTIAGGPTAGVYLDSTPTRCTVSWRNVASFGIPSPTYSLKMTLFPNGNIQFDYDPAVTNNSTFGGVSDNGICGVTPGGGAVLPAASDLSAGGLTADNTLFELWATASTFDFPNDSLLLVPSSPGWTFALLGPAGNCAQSNDFGTGCGGDPPDSIYEDLSNGPFDLVGTTISWIRTPSGYVVTNGTGTYLPPSGSALPVAAGLLDGQQSFPLSIAMPIPGGTTMSLNITTKGQIELSGTPGGIDFTPSTAELLNWPNTAFHCWHDFNQSAGGAGMIQFEQVGGFAFATWNGVASFSSLLTNTFQFQFDLATGNVTLIVILADGIADPLALNAIVVGYSVGGASTDPGATDLSAIPGVVVVSDAPATLAQLTLTTIGVPFLGNSGFGYTLSNVPALIPLGFLFVGSTAVNPGLDLTFLGMPGCFAYTTADLGSASIPVVGNVGSATLPIPSSAGLIGTTFSTQGVAFSLSTPLNLISSNGNTVVVGN